MRLAVAAAFLLFASTALAQPGATEPNQPYGAPQPYAPQPQPYPQPYARQPQPPPPPQYAPYQQQPPVGGLTRSLVIRQIKDPTTARLLSVGVTGLGFLGILAAANDNSEQLGWASLGVMMIGPSAGHIYAGEGGHALKMTLLRTGGLVTFLWGALKSTEGKCLDYCYENENKDGEKAMYVGGAVVLLSTLYDFYDSASAANRYNEKAARAFTLAPTMMSSGTGGTSPGVALSGSF
jgi:hypothetical protein